MSSPAHGNGWRFRLWNGKHWLRWPLRILLGTYVAFVLLVNLAINSKLPWGFLRPSDNSSCITWSWGWSFLPAFATVHNFYLTVEDDNIQMGIRIDRAQVRYSPTAFLHQTFHATAVNASGVSFRFRVKKTAEEIAAQSPETRASLPSIPGFQDPPLRKPPSPPFQGDRSKYWTIQIEGVRADTHEIWIEGARYLGSAHAYGAFTLRPLTVVEVNAGLDVKSGNLTLGDNPLAQELRGSLGVTVDRFDPLPETGVEPLRHISVDLTLDGELRDVALLKPVLRRMRAPDFESSSGHFDLFTRLDHGKLIPASRFELHASRWAMSSGRYRAVGTDTLVEGSIEEALGTSHGVVSIVLGPYQVLDPQLGEELIEGDGMTLRMMSDRLNLLDRPFEDLGFQIQLDAARLPDLTVLNSYLPKSEAFEVLGGTGELTGAFLRPPGGVGSGDFLLDTHQASVRVGRVELQGDLGLKARLSGLASSSRERSILGRSEIEGLGSLTGHFTVADIDAPDDQSSHLLASFSTSAEVVLHPLLPAQVTGPELLLHYLSGELKLDAVIPGLGFLNSTLQPRGLALRGGAGELTLDARLTHGVVGRGTEVDFVSRDIQVTGGGVVGHGDLSVHAQVDETRATPSMTLLSGVHTATIGMPNLPDFVTVQDLSLNASSPEVDLRDLAKLRPTLKLVGQRIVLRDLATLDRWLPESIHLTHGRAEVGLTGESPPEGTGMLEATVEVGGLQGTVGPVSIAGQLTGGARLDGIAEEAWKPELLARSTLAASGALDGHCHLVATSPDARSSAQLRFRANATMPAIQGSQVTGRELAARTVAGVSLAGEVNNLAYVNQFFGKAPVRVQGGSASVRGQVELARGTVAPGSTLALDTHGLQISLGPLRLAGPLHVAGTLGAVDAVDRAQFLVAMDSFTLKSRFEDRVLAQGSGVSFALQAPAFTAEGMLLDSTFQGRAQQLAIPELGSLAAYFPATKDFEVLSGSASASAALDHPSRDHGEAKVEISVDRARILVSGKAITADLRVGAVLRALATAGSDGKPLLQTLDVADTTLDLSGVDLPSGAPADRNWWAKLKVVRGEIGFGDDSDQRISLSADAALEARDALPWLHIYGSEIGIPRWLDGLLAFNQLKASAALELRGNRFALPAFQAQGNHLKLVGRLLLNDQHTSGDFLLDVGPFSMGVDVRDRHSGVQLLGAGSWYRDKLKQPLE